MTNGDGLPLVHYFIAASGNGLMTGVKSDSGDDNMADIPLNGPLSTFGARLVLLCVSSGVSIKSENGPLPAFDLCSSPRTLSRIFPSVT